MKKIGTAYSMFFNLKYKRQGALFGGPFKSKCIKADNNYMRQLFAYIHLNPLEINFPDWENKREGYPQSEMKDFLNTYRYSSYRDYVGESRLEKGIIDKKAFPDYFQTKQSFKNFIENYFIPLS